MAMEVTGGDVVISGHGEFNKNFLEVDRRKKLPTFTVPAGVTIRVYAPPGAGLENNVANLIEEGRYPIRAQLQLEHKDTYKTALLPADYPKSFHPGDEMINYTVAPVGDLKIKGSPITVEEKTSLKSIVDPLSSTTERTVHFACCSSSYALEDEYRQLLPNYGWYVRLLRK
jgi:hypothetical protein